MNPIIADYRLQTDVNTATGVAEAIAWEQTVEAPQALVDAAGLRESMVGRVISIEPEPGDGQAQIARIAYRAELASGQIPQLLNLVYGNVSMYQGVRLVGLELPDELLRQFRGPGLGIEGVRALTGVYGRPLLATAIKPRGLSDHALADIARQFAENGGDLIKDDQNIVDQDFTAFARRVTACRDAVAEGNARSGRNCVYFPNLSAPSGYLPRYLELLRALDIRGALVAPLTIGLDTMRWIAEDWELAIMAHPAMTGGYTNATDQGIAHEVLFGALFRLAGADVSIYPGFGGRISYPHAIGRRIADTLRKPMGHLPAAFPCPAGGQGLHEVPSMIADAGIDSVLLVGGALIGADGGPGVATGRFLRAIREHAEERLTEPQTDAPKSLSPTLKGEIDKVLKFMQDFQWSGRESTAYKLDADADFERARRVELVGQHGEPCTFEVRYFELQPGGYTSLEKHAHIHAVIAVRGQGLWVRADDEVPLKPFDVAVIGPMSPHRLRNSGTAPFGFFCIVDRERDRPIPA